jgi:exopolysaccharide biosynthesis WecB/TagA/CpsF family protein
MSIVIAIDDYDVAETGELAAAFGYERFGYLVTPNVDHLIRYCDDAHFRALYSEASYILLDSQFLAHLIALTRGLRTRVCPGSDLTALVFREHISPADRLVLVGATPAQAAQLQRQFGLLDLRHIDPPMGFIHDAAAVESCLSRIEAASPFRFCFLAIGSPQQEIIASRLKERGRARGLALCVGASIDYMTGTERRAPRWMQRCGIEWLFRLLQNPGRLARRYLLRGPRIFRLLPRLQLQLRRPAAVASGK